MNKIAFIFPGQGSQYIGMGKDFYDNFGESRAVFDEASTVLGIDMKTLVFEENDKLNLTEFTQIAMLTTCVAQLNVVKRLGFEANVSAGLSLGEYSALVNSEVLSLKDALEIVRKRGIIMDNALPKGTTTMAAVIGLSSDEILKVCNETEGQVTIANYNYPGQSVISGEIEAVERASEKLKEIGARRVVPLNVSGAFHSPLLRKAGEELYKVLEPINVKDPTIAYVSNVTGDFVYDNSNIKELLSKQVYSSVKWEQSVINMVESGVNTFVEIGPGKSLTKFIKKISPKSKALNIDKADDLKKLQEELHA